MCGFSLLKPQSESGTVVFHVQRETMTLLALHKPNDQSGDAVGFMLLKPLTMSGGMH